MTEIRLVACDQNLSIGMRPKLASGNKNTVDLSVAFSGHWNGYQKSAVFFSSWDKSVYEIILDAGKCVVPHEVLQFSGYVFIGVRGVDPDTQDVKTSDLVKIRIEKGAPSGDSATKEPTPDVYQQILAKLDKIKNPEKIEETVAQAVTDYLAKNPITGGSRSTIGTANLIADRWMERGEKHYTQVVSIDGVTPHSQIDPTPNADQLAVFYNKELILVFENNSGVVTAHIIGQRLENDYAIQVTITEVST